ncbi:hypothetical protein KCU63_g3929, partial [Aureobasidium melanogenum]
MMEFAFLLIDDDVANSAAAAAAAGRVVQEARAREKPESACCTRPALCGVSPAYDDGGASSLSAMNVPAPAVCRTLIMNIRPSGGLAGDGLRYLHQRCSFEISSAQKVMMSTVREESSLAPAMEPLEVTSDQELSYMRYP